MKKTIKFILASLIGAGLAIWIAESSFGASEPNDASTVYKMGEFPDLDWYISKWESRGFKMPKNGEQFKWSDYIEVVNGAANEYDLVNYTEEDKEKFGLVGAVEDGLSDGKPGVVALVPASSGLVIIVWIPKDQIKTLFRPKVKTVHTKGTSV
jgi:hypothetical protein